MCESIKTYQPKLTIYMSKHYRMSTLMHTRKAPIWAGGFGLAACLLTLIEFPLWRIGGAEPSFLDSQAFSEFVARTKTLYLHRTSLDMFIFTFLFVFMAGFRQFIGFQRLLIIARRIQGKLATKLVQITTKNAIHKKRSPLVDKDERLFNPYVYRKFFHEGSKRVDLRLNRSYFDKPNSSMKSK